MTPGAAVDAAAFKDAMRHFASGVTIVTTILDGKPKGFTATAFSSVSAEPPMVLICVNRSARSHPIIAAAGHFCVNVLAVPQQPLAVAFSTRNGDPFVDVAYRREATGSPVFEESLAFFDCELTEEHTVGTHTIFLGTVVACGSGPGSPLGYYGGGYRDLHLPPA
ncbi:MAG TPA: flavin reductase family protein [Candidatus Acidoferrales bacterium]|nr:flavin reductase family protein [Candidatus Acidoferrales bacterium]